MIGDMFLSYSTQKAKARGSHFEASLGCIVIPFLKIKNITYKMYDKNEISFSNVQSMEFIVLRDRAKLNRPYSAF